MQGGAYMSELDHDIRIEMTGHGRGKVFLDGAEVKGLTMVSFEATPGKVNRVRLGLASQRVTITGQCTRPPILESVGDG